MDTISRENNSMLPIGGIIVGVIGLLLGGFAAIKVSSLQKTVTTEMQPKIEKIDAIESTANSAAAAADKTAKEHTARMREIQDSFTQVGNVLGELRASVTKLEEAAKKPVVAATAGKKGGEPPVAGPGEYIVKAGDSGAKIARANAIQTPSATP